MPTAVGTAELPLMIVKTPTVGTKRMHYFLSIYFNN
jgi:hypothetical protein